MISNLFQHMRFLERNQAPFIFKAYLYFLSFVYYDAIKKRVFDFLRAESTDSVEKPVRYWVMKDKREEIWQMIYIR